MFLTLPLVFVAMLTNPLLYRVQLPRRRQTVTKDPKADLHHEDHASYVNELLRDLDDYTQPNTLPLTRVAADDSLLFCHSHQTKRLSLQHAAYAFDLCTFLINRLDLICNDNGRASQGWKTYSITHGDYPETGRAYRTLSNEDRTDPGEPDRVAPRRARL